MRRFLSLLGGAAAAWSNDNAMRLSAALAYYSIFSLAPLVVIVISVAGLAFGEQAARGQVAEQLRQLAGDRTAEAIQALVASTSSRKGSVTAVALGFVVLLFGASGVFGELRSALNSIWGVQLKPGRVVLATLMDRAAAFAAVLSVGFLLMVSLVLSAVVTACGHWLQAWLHAPQGLWSLSDVLVSLVVITFLFAMVFRLMPNVIIAWRDVFPPAIVTALLFTLGKFGIGFYLGTSGVSSSYGAAGSVVIILLWVYYNACILFYGTELSKAWTLERGGQVRPDGRAVLIKAAQTKGSPRTNPPFEVAEGNSGGR